MTAVGSVLPIPGRPTLESMIMFRELRNKPVFSPVSTRVFVAPRSGAWRYRSCACIRPSLRHPRCTDSEGELAACAVVWAQDGKKHQPCSLPSRFVWPCVETDAVYGKGFTTSGIQFSPTRPPSGSTATFSLDVCLRCAQTLSFVRILPVGSLRQSYPLADDFAVDLINLEAAFAIIMEICAEWLKMSGFGLALSK